MNDPIIWQILLQVLLIALNAVFACAEIAVISMNDNKLAQMAAQGDKRAVRLARLTSQPARFLATIQVAITLSGFMGSAFAADNFSDKLVQWLLSLGVTVPVATLDTVSVIVITLILSYFTLVFGELVPKRIAMKKAEALALGMSGLITAISKLFAPLVWLLTASTNGILRLFGIDPNAEDEE
ncbi:MAG: CNNM domain-containing protein, partial [Oscillospiraceae bacterium]